MKNMSDITYEQAFEKRIAALEAKLKAKHDTSELLHEIDELNRHNKVLQKADMHREKIWKKRVVTLEREVDMWRKHVPELETQLANFESDAYVLSLLTKIDELEANLDAVEKCQRYTIGVVNDVHYSYTTDNPDGEWMRTKDVLKALGEAK